ncbi:MAG: biotin--[acetyl-CoA-carboxylase] ligase [bacterium]|jgi:BirA family transcriptional regulator, biotin operon repressor / biotin---[acetyl-CoA-carboxylase] ligase
MDYHIIHIPVLTSTNEYMQLLLDDREYDEGLIVSTEFQQKGKGHGNNQWESEKGSNLLFSLLLKPAFIEPSDQFVLTTCVSMALVRTLKKWIDNLPVTIKWPNDIYVGDKKISGILMQHTIRGNRIKYSIAGIGLNVNQRSFSKEIPNPVSIARITGSPVNRQQVMNDLLGEIKTNYETLPSAAQREALHAGYCNSLYRYQEWSMFNDGKTFKARITGITAFGQLILEKDNGRKSTYGFKEVELLV